MKKSLIIISVFGVTAAISVTIYLANQKLRHNDNAKKQKSTEKEPETCLINPNEDLHEKKVAAAATISQRRNIAAQIMEDALVEEDGKISEHKVEFDKIEKDLDQLLEGE